MLADNNSFINVLEIKKCMLTRLEVQKEKILVFKNVGNSHLTRVPNSAGEVNEQKMKLWKMELTRYSETRE